MVLLLSLKKQVLCKAATWKIVQRSFRLPVVLDGLFLDKLFISESPWKVSSYLAYYYF